MEKNDKELPITSKIISKIDDTTNWFLNQGRVLFENVYPVLTPLVGQDVVVSILLQIYPLLVSKSGREHFEEHIPDLTDRMRDILPEINKEFTNSPEGQKILRDTIVGIMNDIEEEKIEARKLRCLNSITKGSNEPYIIKQAEELIEKPKTLESQLLEIFKDPGETIRKIFETKKDDKSDFINIKIFEDINNLMFNKSDDDFSLALRRLRDEGLIHFNWIADGNAQKNMIHVGPRDSFHKNNFQEGINQMVKRTKDLVTGRGRTYTEVSFNNKFFF